MKEQLAMMSVIHFKPRQILIPLIIHNEGNSMSIKTAEGKLLPLQYTKGLSIYNRRICLEADWLGSEENRHRVKLPDGQICWIKQNPVEVDTKVA
jgi:hypothetical protein